MNCTNCGSVLKEGASFCEQCGHAVVHKQEAPVQEPKQEEVKMNQGNDRPQDNAPPAQPQPYQGAPQMGAPSQSVPPTAPNQPYQAAPPMGQPYQAAPPPPPQPPRPTPPPSPTPTYHSASGAQAQYQGPQGGYQPPPVAPVPAYKPPVNDSVMTTGNWFITILIMAIPLVGLIMMFVWAFGSEGNVNRRNFAKAALIWALVGIVLSIVFMIIISAIGASLFTQWGNQFDWEYYGIATLLNLIR